jgi:uncharacterized membrane protein YcaP (DUF421 family)
VITVIIPEWLVWTLLVLIAVQAVLQLVLAVLRIKIDRAQKIIDAKLTRFGIAPRAPDDPQAERG